MHANLSLSQIADVVDRALMGGEPSMQEYLRVHRGRYIYTLRELIKHLPKQSFLEIGSGGLFLKLMQDFQPQLNVAGTMHASASSELKTPVGYRWPDVPADRHYQFYLGDLELAPYTASSESFDLILCSEVIEHMSKDPMAMIGEINRLMMPGGTMVLTTPNIASIRSIKRALDHESPLNFHAFNVNGSTDRHNVEYTPGLISDLVRAGGFTITSLFTESCWSSPDPVVESILRHFDFRQDLRGDNTFLVAAKTSGVLDRYPASMYV